MMKSLWASVIENPSRFKKINGWMTVFWLAAIPVCYSLGWLDSTVFISALSLYAIVTGHLSTWQAARVEVRQEEKDSNGIDKKVEEIHDEVTP